MNDVNAQNRHMMDHLDASDGAWRLQQRLAWQKQQQSHNPVAKKIAVLSTFTIDPLQPYLGMQLQAHGIHVDIHVGPYNQIMQECLIDDSATAHYHPDILIVSMRFEDLFPDFYQAKEDDAHTYRKTIADITTACISAAERWQAQLLYILPPIPEMSLLGVGDDGTVTSVFALATSLREQMRHMLADKASILLIDAEVVIRTVGVRQAYNYPLLTLAHIPFSEEVFALLGQRIARLTLLAASQSERIVILDADALLFSAFNTADPARSDRQNTLNSGPRQVSRLLQNYLLAAREQGIQLALFSRCGEEAIWHIFDSAEMQLKPEHLCAWTIDDEACAKKINALLEELHTDASTCVFVSVDETLLTDSREHFPALKVVHLPADPSYWLIALNNAGICDHRRLAASSVRIHDEQSHVYEHEKEETPKQNTTLEHFLASLDLSISFRPLEPFQIQTAAELTRATVEFTMTGIEQSPTEIRSLLEKQNYHFWLVYVQDRFGDYGVSGMFAYTIEDQTLSVKTLLLSCPVLGKNVEERVYAELQKIAHEHACTSLHMCYRPTPRNEPALQFLQQIQTSCSTSNTTHVRLLPVLA